MPDEEYLSTISQMKFFMVIVGFIAILIALTVFFFFALSLANNLKKGVDFARRIAEGDLNATIDIDQKDEIGDLANALRSMSDELRTAITDINSGSSSGATGCPR